MTPFAAWGRNGAGRQLISGPLLVIPVEEEVLVTGTRDVIDPETGRVMVHEESGRAIQEAYEETLIKDRPAVHLFPDQFDAKVTTSTQMRHRGIFQVPVYQAELGMDLSFPLDQAETLLKGEEKLLWDQAYLIVGVTSNRALRGEAVLRADSGTLPLEPSPVGAGIQAELGDPRNLGGLRLTLGLNGAEQLQIAAVGRTTRVEMVSDWPDPSFQGAFLPDGSEISETGFSATWTIPHLARNLPQAARDNYLSQARNDAAFGVAFYQPNDFYQKAWRAARYGILFIALTFLTVLLIEGAREKPVHPVQYILDRPCAGDLYPADAGLCRTDWLWPGLSGLGGGGNRAAYAVCLAGVEDGHTVLGSGADAGGALRGAVPDPSVDRLRADRRVHASLPGAGCHHVRHPKRGMVRRAETAGAGVLCAVAGRGASTGSSRAGAARQTGSAVAFDPDDLRVRIAVAMGPAGRHDQVDIGAVGVGKGDLGRARPVAQVGG